MTLTIKTFKNSREKDAREMQLGPLTIQSHQTQCAVGAYGCCPAQPTHLPCNKCSTQVIKARLSGMPIGCKQSISVDPLL